jgi:D-sedoheptulose 7-phosphate isomerase
MLGAELSAAGYLNRAAAELHRIDPAEMEALAQLVEQAWRERKFVFVIGNGGSGANASHLCEDLGKCTLRREDFDELLDRAAERGAQFN